MAIIEKKLNIKNEEILLNLSPSKRAYFFKSNFNLLPILIILIIFDIIVILLSINIGLPSDLVSFIVTLIFIHTILFFVFKVVLFINEKRWENTKYYITQNRIIIQTGFIESKFETIYYDEVTDVSLKIDFLDKYLKVGEITISKKDDFKILYLEDPVDNYQKIQKIIFDIKTDIKYPNATRPTKNEEYKSNYRPF